MRLLVLTLAEELGIAVGEEVDDGSSLGGGTRDVLLAGLSGDESPELLDVEGRGPLVVALEVEVPHTDLTEVTRMVYSSLSAFLFLYRGETSGRMSEN